MNLKCFFPHLSYRLAPRDRYRHRRHRESLPVALPFLLIRCPRHPHPRQSSPTPP